MILGSIALLATIAVVCIHIILAVSISSQSPVKTVAIVSVILEALVLVLLGWLSVSHVLSMRNPSRQCPGVALGLSIFVCILAAAASAVTFICLSKIAPNMEDGDLGVTETSFLVGSSVALCISFACQLIFMVVHFVSARAAGLDSAFSLHTDDGDRPSPASRVKGIRYSQTFPSMVHVRETASMDSQKPPSSLETMGSVSSKTRLLSVREKRRPSSLDTDANRGSTDDTFESWDTSTVDLHNRQIVLEASSPPSSKTRHLETIPASPTISRSPSPGSPLEPPHASQRGRSYSPASRRREPSLTSQRSSSELNIHPLFRSDSPTPPPLATPGTVVMASPNAGQVIKHQQSMRSVKSVRSLQRMRSGSLPTTPSPLSRQGSFESASVKKQVDEQGSIAEVDEEQSSQRERQMTPPIPEWVLSAGTRTSLTGYNTRKVKGEDEEE